MSTKGTLTFVYNDRFSDKHRGKTKVFWMDGYDAWLAIYNNYGEKNQRTSKPASYGFTANVTDKIIKISPKYVDEYAIKTVHDRTLQYHKFQAGNLINQGWKLTWLSEPEMQECLTYFITKNKEYDNERARQSQSLQGAVCQW